MCHWSRLSGQQPESSLFGSKPPKAISANGSIRIIDNPPVKSERFMNKINPDHTLRLAATVRDRHTRRNLLTAVHESIITPSGWVSAVTLRDMVKDNVIHHPDQEHDRYWIRLLRELCIKGLIEERRLTKLRNEEFALRHVEYRIQSRGLSLCLESIPPDPDIEDDRVIIQP